MNVRAKMRVIEKKNLVSAYGAPGKPTCSVVLAPVADDANKTWAKYTPSGRVEMSIDNPEAYEAFAIGGTYFVDFTPAPATEAEETK